jgi:ketosteroid isomerase-like protein
MQHDFRHVTEALEERQARANSRTKLEAIGEILKAIASKDFGQVEEFFHEDAEMAIHGITPFNRHTKGHKQILKALHENFEAVTDQKPVIEALVEQDSEVVVKLSETGTLRESGKNYTVRAVLWFTFEDNRIRKIEEFADSTI